MVNSNPPAPHPHPIRTPPAPHHHLTHKQERGDTLSWIIVTGYNYTTICRANATSELVYVMMMKIRLVYSLLSYSVCYL